MIAEIGGKGEEFNYWIEMRTMADIGLVSLLGMCPNWNFGRKKKFWFALFIKYNNPWHEVWWIESSAIFIYNYYCQNFDFGGAENFDMPNLEFTY